MCELALWSTRHTRDVANNSDLLIKTTLKELILYIIYLVILVISELFFDIFISESLLSLKIMCFLFYFTI